MPDTAASLPELDAEFWRVVDEGLNVAGLGLDAAQRLAIDRHIRLLLAWNAAINLSGLRTAEQVARNHVLDSLIAAPVIAELAGDATSVLDIGTGAGFPGLPLGIFLRPKRLGLVDSIGKKARFLSVASREVTAALAGDGVTTAPEITVLPERAEDLADEADQREGWHIIVARAVGTVAEVAELGLPLAAVGGQIVAWKFDSPDGGLQREVATSESLVHAAGGGRPRLVQLSAARRVGLAGHCLVVITKQRPTPARFPRQPAERRPPQDARQPSGRYIRS